MAGNVLDVFSGDAFSVVAMTNAINKLPYKPSRLSKVFRFQGINTTSVLIEEKAGKLSLIPTKVRNSGGSTKQTAEKRKARTLSCVHLPFEDTVWADDVQGVRAFGSADALETIDTKVNDKMQSMRSSHEVTHEYHRIGAVGGVVLDADGTTEIYDLFDEFDLTKQVIDFQLDDPLTDVKHKCSEVTRYMQGKLGAVTFNGITCLCGDDFWDMLVQHESVKKAYERAAENSFAREDQRIQGGFLFAGIFFENYRGSVGNVPFVPAAKARFFPEGVTDLFMHWGAPANWIETVNTIGLPVYAKQVEMRGNVGREIWSQSNPLIVCTQPEVLVEGTTDVIDLGSGVADEA